MTRSADVERVHVVSYDIADDRRRQRVSSILEAHGQRVQWSVFEIVATGRAIDDLLSRITASDKTFDTGTDSLRAYPLCSRCREHIDTRGCGRPASVPGNPLVL